MLCEITIVIASVLSYPGSYGLSTITTLKMFKMIALLMIAHGKTVVLLWVFDEGDFRVAAT